MARSRLANLSYAQLLEFTVDACESSPEIKNKADALIAEVAPLPAWCVDILLSPDLLPQLFSSLGLSEHAAASVCSTWSGAYSRQLRRCRYVDPTRVQQLADVPTGPSGLCMLPGGVLAIAYTTREHANGRETAVKFIAARNDSAPQALAAYRASSLAARRFEWLMGLALTNDALLVCSWNDPPTTLYKFAKDGSMDELATVDVLADYSSGFKQCAIGEDEGGNHALVLLDANLQVIATVETAVAPEDATEYYVPIRDVAVHGDQVIVLTSNDHPKGSGLRLLDPDGRFLLTSLPGGFTNPKLSQGPLWSTKPSTTTRTKNRAWCSTSSTSSQATSCKVYASTYCKMVMTLLLSLSTATRATSRTFFLARSSCYGSRGPRREGWLVA